MTLDQFEDAVLALLDQHPHTPAQGILWGALHNPTDLGRELREWALAALESCLVQGNYLPTSPPPEAATIVANIIRLSGYGGAA